MLVIMSDTGAWGGGGTSALLNAGEGQARTAAALTYGDRHCCDAAPEQIMLRLGTGHRSERDGPIRGRKAPEMAAGAFELHHRR